MGKTLGYIRVSSDKQTVENQRLAIHDYCQRNKLRVDDFIKVEMSTRRTPTQRRIDELLDRLQEGDTLIVAELSRLARSVGQIATTVDTLIKNTVKVIIIKENLLLNGRLDMNTKATLGLFSILAEIERDMISERTKEGLRRARAEGKLLGRPKGTIGKSKLDGKEEEIKKFLKGGINKTNIARYLGVSWSTLENFIKTRKLA